MIPVDQALVTDLIRVLSRLAEEQSYGSGPLCADPRDFHPDPECSTEEERAAHADACRRAEAGEEVAIPRSGWRSFASAEEASAYVRDTPGVAAVSFAGPGKLSHVNVQAWGLGTSIIRDPEMAELRDRLAAALVEAGVVRRPT